MRKRDEILNLFRSFGKTCYSVLEKKRVIRIEDCYGVSIDLSRTNTELVRLRSIMYTGPHITYSIKNKNGGNPAPLVGPSITNGIKAVKRSKFKVVTYSFLSRQDAEDYITYMKKDGLMDNYGGLMIHTRNLEIHMDTASRALDRLLKGTERSEEVAMASIGALL